MLGVDDMREAIEKGYLGGKLVIPKTIKMTDEMMDAISVVAEVYEKDPTEWMREIIAQALLVEDVKYDRMTRARMRAKNTSDTLGNHEKSPSAVTDEPNVH